MAFTNRLLLIVPGFGTPIQNDTLFLKTAVSLTTTGEQTNSLTGLTPAIKSGWIRIKVYTGGGTSPTLTSVRISVTDGTTTEWIAEVSPATAYTLAANNQITLSFPFLSELAVTQVNVLTTLGGTTPTASLDIEVGASN